MDETEQMAAVTAALKTIRDALGCDAAHETVLIVAGEGEQMQTYGMGPVPPPIMPQWLLAASAVMCDSAGIDPIEHLRKMSTDGLATAEADILNGSSNHEPDS